MTSTPETQSLREANAARLGLRAVERHRPTWLECAFWTVVAVLRRVFGPGPRPSGPHGGKTSWE
jgi:hypothetical protein